MSESVAIVVPARNEEEVIEQTLRSLPANICCIVVNNGSTDNTAAIAKACGKIVIHENRPGYGRTVLAGILHAKQLGKEIAVIYDADGADYPSNIKQLIDPILADEADFCIGQRAKYAEVGALTKSQKFGNKLSVQMIRLITGYSFSDMGPLRAIKISCFQQMDMQDPTYGWNIEMQIKAVRCGLRIKQFEFAYRQRQAGVSKISGDLYASIKAGVKIIQTGLRYMR